MPGRRGKPAGVGAILRSTCKRAALGAAERRDGPNRLLAHAELCRGGRGVRRLFGRDRALPGDQHALVAQQRRGVLDQHGQRRERARADHVASTQAVLPLLRARPHDLGVVQVHLARGGAQERALAADRLDEDDVGRRQRRGEHQPGQPRPGAEVGDEAAPLGAPGPRVRRGSPRCARAPRPAGRGPRSARPRCPEARSACGVVRATHRRAHVRRAAPPAPRRTARSCAASRQARGSWWSSGASVSRETVPHCFT